eukprot:RCo005047
MGASESVQSLLEQNRLDDFKALLSRPGMDVNAGLTSPALYVAVECDCVEAVRWLLAQPGVDVNRDGGPPMFRQSPLFLAVHNGNCEITAALLAHPEINVNKGYYSTPLLHAIERNHGNLVAALLQHPRVDPNYGFGMDPLTKALACGNSEALKLLLEHPATKVSERCPQLLLFALRSCCSDLLQALVRHPQVKLDEPFVDPSTPKDPPQTALFSALLLLQRERHAASSPLSQPESSVGTGGYWVPDMVMAQPVDTNGDELDRNSLHSIPEQWRGSSEEVLPEPVRQSGSRFRIQQLKEMIGILLSSASLDPNKGRAGQTPLHFAAQQGWVDVVKLLLQHPRTDVGIADAAGHTACDVARLWGNTAVVKELELAMALVPSTQPAFECGLLC